MRRMILAAATGSLVLALAPASALARHHSHHHKRHHAAHHARVHRVTHRRFGDVNNPATTTTPTSSAVGTVDSFDGTTLTIKLNNGSTVSGMVTNDTEIECEMAENQVENDLHRDGGGSGEGSGSNSGRDGGDNGDDNGGGDDEGEHQGCTTSALTPGASVSGAELKISSAGAVWDKVDLIS
jgi:hypothetical protein